MVSFQLSRYNVCIMAYGQTGSGKTHTMLGKAPALGRKSRENGARRPSLFILSSSCFRQVLTTPPACPVVTEFCHCQLLSRVAQLVESSVIYSFFLSHPIPFFNRRALTEIARLIEERSTEFDIELRLSVCEIYNNKIRDLLSGADDDSSHDVVASASGIEVPTLTQVRL